VGGFLEALFAVIAVTLIAMLPGSAPLAAQDAAAPRPLTPPGWAWRTDRPAEPQRGGTGRMSDAVFEFVHMAPGWHVTMGPGGNLFEPGARLAGRFGVEAEMILFPDASDGEYGVFVGGTGLDGAAEWTAFVVRADGSAAVMRRAAGATTMLMPWAPHSAVKVKATGATAKNYVTVRAEPDSVRFVVNGERVAAWPRAGIPVDGNFGFRIGRGVNLHITNLDVTRRLAPFPDRR
jgi:hypothetical protein